MLQELKQQTSLNLWVASVTWKSATQIKLELDWICLCSKPKTKKMFKCAGSVLFIFERRQNGFSAPVSKFQSIRTLFLKVLAQREAKRKKKMCWTPVKNMRKWEKRTSLRSGGNTWFCENRKVNLEYKKARKEKVQHVMFAWHPNEVLTAVAANAESNECTDGGESFVHGLNPALAQMGTAQVLPRKLEWPEKVVVFL